MSSWLLMGLPGVAYLTGISDAGWTAIGLGLGTYLNWLIVAKRLRRYSVKCNAITIPDFFSRRFRDEKNILMCIAAIVILIFFIPYTASGFKAIGTLFSSLFGVEYHVAMIVGAVVIRRLHRHGRFYGRIYYRPDSEYCYEYFSGSYRILRNPSGRRLGRGYGKCELTGRISFYDADA